MTVGSVAQTLSNTLSQQTLRNGGWSWVSGIGKTIKDTAKTVAPVLTKAGHTKLLGLGLKLGGIGLAGIAGLSLAKNIYNGARNLAGAPSYDTATGDGIKGAIDIFTGASALGLAFGGTTAIPALIGLGASGLFSEYERLADGTSKVYDVPVLKALLTNQATDGTWAAPETPILRASYDWAIESDNNIRRALGFSETKLRKTETEKYNRIIETVNSTNGQGYLGIG